MSEKCWLPKKGSLFSFDTVTMKKKISELNAVAAIMDSCFEQVEARWTELWEPVEQIQQDSQLPIQKPKFVRFNFTLAVLAINTRASFDLLPRERAERLYTILQQLLKKNLGDGPGFHAVINSLVKFTEAYNNGVLHIRNPLYDVAMLLYYKIGLENTEQFVVDESYYIPEPRLVEYLTKSLVMFAGKWDMLLARYELIHPSGRAPMEAESPALK